MNGLFPGLSDLEAKALVDVATAIGTQPQWLWEVINFESRHDPLAKNPLSSARGLVQFIDSTAQGMGYKDSADLVKQHPTYEDQLRGPVLTYFRRQGAPFTSRQALYMSVFLPIARNVPADTTFESLYKTHYGSQAPAKYALFVKQNPGIKTVFDYIQKTQQKAVSMWTKGSIHVAEGGGAALGLLILAAVFYYRTRGG